MTRLTGALKLKMNFWRGRKACFILKSLAIKRLYDQQCMLYIVVLLSLSLLHFQTLY